MRKNFAPASILAGLSLILPAVLSAQQGSCGLESQLQALAPPRILSLEQKLKDAEGNPPPINIVCVRADFDGSGQFGFIVAGYGVPVASTIRVFHQVEGQLQVVADQAPELDGSSSRMDLRLADINNDGRTEIVVKAYGQNTDYGLSILALSGATLQDLSPDGNTVDADLFDIDGSGKLAIVTPPDTFGGSSPDYPVQRDGNYQVFKFNGTKYALAFSTPNDPTNIVSSTRANRTVFATSRLKPERFASKQVLDAGGKHDVEEGVVMLRLGNLTAPLDDNPGPRSVQDFDLKSLTLGRALRPSKVEIVRRDEDEGDADNVGRSPEQQGSRQPRLQGPFLQAHFSRQALLQFLPRTQLTKPLTTGDVLNLDVTGKMTNGAPVFGTVTVKIVGDDDRHDKN